MLGRFFAEGTTGPPQRMENVDLNKEILLSHMQEGFIHYLIDEADFNCSSSSINWKILAEILPLDYLFELKSANIVFIMDPLSA